MRAFGAVDIFVSHGPPAGVMDWGTGSTALAELARDLAPKVHVFGHQHNCFGAVVLPPTAFLNASSTDGLFSLVKPPLVVDVAPRAAAAAASSGGRLGAAAGADVPRGAAGADNPRGAAATETAAASSDGFVDGRFDVDYVSGRLVPRPPSGAAPALAFEAAVLTDLP